jgi:hypothetical protein
MKSKKKVVKKVKSKRESAIEMIEMIRQLYPTAKKPPKQEYEKDFPRIAIERIGFRQDGRIDYIDMHDEKFGEAIFFGNGSRHPHGFLNGGNFNKDL